MTTKNAESRIPCSRETRERIAAQKRGGEPYESVLRKMVAQYDPEDATEDITIEAEGSQDD